jgi:hypothetical protein
MSIRVNIENLLNSEDEIFKSILLEITSKTAQNAKSEIRSKCKEKDETLFDAISLILKDLKNEEGYISRLLYRLFRFEFRENIRRKQLLILGSELKSQYIQVEKDLYRIRVYKDNLLSTIKILQKFRKAFKDKFLFLVDNRLAQKAKYYIERIEAKIRELDSYSIRLRDKLVVCEKLEAEYRNLLKKIPRYYELNSSVDMLLEDNYERRGSSKKYSKSKREAKRGK